MGEENQKQNNFSYALKEMPLTFNDILIPTSLYNQNHHSRKHTIEQPDVKMDSAIIINSPPRGFKIDKQTGDYCPKLYKKCHGKDVTCLADSKKYEGCEVYQKYLAKHQKKKNHNNHVNPENNNSGLEDKTIQ